jgi:mono/diheme cytochrome c family protein
MKVPSCVASCVILGLLGAGSGPVLDAQTDAPQFETTVKPFLTKNCFGCHNSQLKTAGVDFTQFKTSESAIGAPDVWEKAIDKLRQSAMPPPPIPRPKQADVDAVILWMEGAVAQADANVRPDPGRVTAHRLNRVEYDNTVRDLLGVDIHPSADFPQDDSGYGFDNIGDVLTLSPILMERYMNAAGKLVATAIHGPEKLKPVLERHQPTTREFELFPKAKADYDVTGLSMPNALHTTHLFPVDGEYTIRVALEGRRPAGSEPVSIGVWLDGKQVQTLSTSGRFDGGSFDLFGAQAEFRTRVPAGEHWLAASVLHIYEGLPPSYGGPKPSSLPEPPPPDPAKFMKVKPGASPEEIAQARHKAEERVKKMFVPANRVVVHFVEVVGPYNQRTAPYENARNLIFVCGNGDEHSAGCPKRIIAHFARRAFRRPVSSGELQPYLELYASARKGGSSFDDSIGVALQAILVSPDFLFRIETPEVAANRTPKFKNVSFGGQEMESDVAPVSEYALASRLSYFLWSTMPDDELMRCADKHILRRPEVLKAQVIRMLRDPRSQALADNFAGQWLELRKLESVHPDHDRFPQWDDYLRMSMQQETELFFENVVRNNDSILEFLDGKTTFLNQKLAEFYGIPGVQGTEFRKVSLEGTHRAGLLTQASIMTVSSYATRTSPVIRGKWVLENFMNATIPPPPPNVPRLDESKVGSDSSIRQQMEAHRANPMCAACHSKMDPIGFSFENFSAIGEWRDKDGKWPIDASGKLPSGQTFNGAMELEAIYRKNPEPFIECVTYKLLTYALGRGLERYDRPTVKEISKRIAADDYRFDDLVLEIVNSLPFEMSRVGART